MPRYLTAFALLALFATGCARNRGEMPADNPPLEVTATLPAAAETRAAAAPATSEALTTPEGTEAPAATPVPLDCAAPAEGSVEWVACNVAAGLRSRNLSALHGSMADPFVFGLWRSEGRTEAPAAITEYLSANHLPTDAATPMTFTADRTAVPVVDGMSAEGLMGPDVPIAQVVYSTGWGKDGEGAALLYFTEDAAGKPTWYSLIVAPTGFQ